eukprot:gene6293-2926_t
MADRGRKAQPVSSHTCDEKWQAHCQKLHKQRLDKMKKRIDNAEPECNSLNIDKFNNPKRRMLDLERQTEIDNENRHLLDKMIKIKNFDSTKVFKPWLGRTTFQWKPGAYYDPASNTKCVDHNSKLLKAIDNTRSEYSMERGPGWKGKAVEGARELRWGGLQEQHKHNATYSYQQSNYRGPDWARYAPLGSPPKERPYNRRPGSAGTDPLGSRYTGAFDSPVLGNRQRATMSARPGGRSASVQPARPRDEDEDTEYGWTAESGPSTSSGNRKPPGLPRSSPRNAGDPSTPTKASPSEGSAPPSPSGSTISRRSASGSASKGSASPYLQSALDHKARSRPASASAYGSPRASVVGSPHASAAGSRPTSAAARLSRPPSTSGSAALRTSRPTSAAAASATASRQAGSRPVSRPASAAAPPAVDPGASFGNDAVDGLAGMEDMTHEDLSKSAAFPPASVINMGFLLAELTMVEIQERKNSGFRREK